MSVLFISHSSRDEASARSLEAELEAQGHHSVFLDLDPEKGIMVGASWERTLYTKLRSCRAIVALCSDNYLTSQWCFAELALARMEGKEIYALQIEPWHEGTELPSILADRQLIDLRSDQKIGYQKLRLGFEAKGIVPSRHRSWVPGRSPYPGLRAFAEQDTAVFFGRERLVQDGTELLTRLERQGYPRLLMVLGASGSGKSSLMRAGILPRLRADAAHWQIVGPFRPGPRPLEELASAFSHVYERTGRSRTRDSIRRALDRAAGIPGTSALTASDARSGALGARRRLLQAVGTFARELDPADETVANLLHELETILRGPAAVPSSPEPDPPSTVPTNHSGPLVRLTDEIRGWSPASPTVVLVIDQFEELLGDADQGEDHPANRFLTLLRDALETPGAPLLALATMRSDYLATLQGCPQLEDVGFTSLSVGAVAREGLRELIEGPATLGQIQLGDGLTEALLDDIGSPEALPLLAFTLSVMWDRHIDFERGARVLTLEHYIALGRLHGAVARVADEALEAALRLGRERDLEDAFLNLARASGEGSGWVRQSVPWDEFAESVRPMLECFVDQRLLVRRSDGAVEVAHEALFRSWDKLRRWLDENAEGLHQRREIRADAQKWAEAGDLERELYLWRGGRLHRAMELRDDGRLRLAEGELEFLEAGEELESRAARGRRRRRRVLLGGTSLAALVMAVLAALAYIGQWNAKIQVARGLAIQARTGAQPLDQSLLIAVEAARRLERLDAAAEMHEARTTLSQLLLSYPRPERLLHGHSDRIWTVALSPDGRTFATGSSDGRLLVWQDQQVRWNLDHCTLRPLSPEQPWPPCGDRIKQIEFSLDGARLISSDTFGQIIVWNAKTGALERVLEARGAAEIEALAISPDGRNLASGDGQGWIRLWNLADARAVTLGRHESWVSRIAFSEDGWVLSAGADQTLRLWHTSRDEGGIVCRGDGTAVYGLDVTRDGTVAAGFGDGSIRVWPAGELAGKKLNTTPPPPPPCNAGAMQAHEGEIRTLRFSPDGRTMASAAVGDGLVKIWDVPRLSERAVFDGHGRGAWAVDIGPNGEIITGAGDGMLRVWDIERVAHRVKRLESRDRLLRVAFGGESSVATGDANGIIRLVNLPDLGDGPTLAPMVGEVSGLAMDRANRYLAASIDLTVFLWDREKLAEVGDERMISPEFVDSSRHRRWSWQLAFSPDGSLLASSDDDGNVWLWQVPSGEVQDPLRPGASVVALAFDPTYSRARLAVGTKRGDIEIWDTETGTVLRKFSGHEKPVVGLAFSPDGRRLASASLDRSVRVWGTTGGEELLLLRGHEAQVTAITYSPDGRRIASGDAEGIIRIWNAASGLPELSLAAHDGLILRLTFEDSAWLVSGGQDRTLRRWDIGSVDSTESAYRLACRIANRDLRADEWSKHFPDTPNGTTCSDYR